MSRIACFITSPNEAKAFSAIQPYLSTVPLDVFVYYWRDGLPRLEMSSEPSDSVPDLDLYERVIVFNDISLLAEIIDDHRRTRGGRPFLVLVQEGSTDTTFRARKAPTSDLGHNLRKLRKYFGVGLRNRGALRAVWLTLRYMTRRTKPPYGHGVAKDSVVFSSDLELENYGVASVKSGFMEHWDVISQTEADLPTTAVIVHQPLYEQVGFRAHHRYYATLLRELRELGLEVVVRLHPRWIDRDPAVRFFHREGVRRVGGAHGAVYVGFSSTLLLERFMEGEKVLAFSGGLDAPRNLCFSLLSRSGNTLECVAETKTLRTATVRRTPCASAMVRSCLLGPGLQA